MHSLDAPAHGVGSRGKEVVEWPGFGTIRTGVEVIDVTTVGVTVIHVCEAFDGIRRDSAKTFENICLGAVIVWE